MKSFPDKNARKETTTMRLRRDIAAALQLYESSSFLEIGSASGFTILSIAEYFSNGVGLEINEERLEVARFFGRNTYNVTFKSTTSEDIDDHYDVVFIDACHDYENVKNDLMNTLLNNTAKIFTIFFHDYGLVDSGVKKCVLEFFNEDEITQSGEYRDWNPLGGPVNDCEAVQIKVTPEIKSRILNQHTSQ